MFDEIDDLVKSIDQFKSNIVNSEKLLEALDIVTRKIEVVNHENRSTADIFLENSRHIVTKVLESNQGIVDEIKLVSATNHEGTKKVVTMGDDIIKNIGEISTQMKAIDSQQLMLSEIVNSYKDSLKNVESEQRNVQSKVSDLKKRNDFLAILTGAGFILVILLQLLK